MQFSLSYPLWFLLFCVLAGFAFTWFLYSRDTKFSDKPKWVQNSLKILRFLTGFGITFLLLAPIFKDQTTEQKDPLVIMLTDQSQSIKSGMNTNTLDRYLTNVSNLKDKLKGKYEFVELGFGDQTYLIRNDSLNQKITNISQALEHVYDTYSDQNIGAIILNSDGIFNEGSSPVYSKAKFSAPVYTIGLGDTTIRRDLIINDVLSNKIAYLGDKFAIQVGISNQNAANVNSKISVFEEDVNGVNRIIAEKQISFGSESDYQNHEFILDAKKTGVVKYSVLLSTVSGEYNTINNRKDFYVEVIDARIKLLIYANGPHPDVGALTGILEENKNYDVKSAFAYDNVNVSDFDFVIFHNLPSQALDISTILKQLDNKGVNRLFFFGSQTDQPKFNAAQSVVNITGNSSANDVIEPVFSGGFDKFVISEELKNRLLKYPPIIAPFGSYKAGNLSNVLFYQRIKKVPTQNPLVVFEDKNGKRTGVFVGEGLWKWKMQDMVDFEDNRFVNELISKSIQYLSVKDDKRKFRVNNSKNIYRENEPVLLDAQLYNDAFEMINTPEVFITIKNNKGDEYKYNFSKVNNYYVLNPGTMSPGSYTYAASTSFDGKAHTATGRFSVENIQLELNNLTAQHATLKALSEQNGGKYYHHSDFSSLADVILGNDKIKPTLYSSIRTQMLLEKKWFFFLLLFILGFEWFLRRYFGSY